jgi:hypothetical protein
MRQSSLLFARQYVVASNALPCRIVSLAPEHQLEQKVGERFMAQRSVYGSLKFVLAALPQPPTSPAKRTSYFGVVIEDWRFARS